MVKYEVNFYDKTNGATSPIDTIEVEEGYTPQDYIDDCDSNGNTLHDIKGGNEFEIIFQEIKEDGTMVEYIVSLVKSDVRVNDENRKYASALADASSTDEEKAEAFDYFVDWVASHPEDLSPDEINRYDSEQDARTWALEHAEDVVEVLDSDWVRCEVYYIEDFEVDEDGEIDYNYCGGVDYGFNNPYAKG